MSDNEHESSNVIHESSFFNKRKGGAPKEIEDYITAHSALFQEKEIPSTYGKSKEEEPSRNDPAKDAN